MSVPRSVAHEETDLGNAEVFVSMHGDRLRYVRDRREWLVYEEGRWRRDDTGEAERAAKEVARERLLRATEVDGADRAKAAKWALASQSEPRIRAMLALAASERELVLRSDALDIDPFLLGCGNGVVDLRSGRLRPSRPEDMLSLGTDIGFDPDAPRARWERFVEEIFNHDYDLVAFFKRACGYTLTGDTREQVFFVLHGGGCNGKSTAVEIGKRVLGGLAQTSAFDSFARTRGDRAVRNDLARLHRARLVVASESGKDRRIDEAVVKLLTGGDTITTRFLYAEHFEYVPQFKLWLVSNHRPRIDGDDDAIWRRVRLIPFNVSFMGREDPGLRDALAAELPGILAWCVEGCLEWQRDGLGLAPAVGQATSEYRQDEDVLGAFLEERCRPGGQTTAVDLRAAFDAYCRESGERTPTAADLGRQLSRRGVTAARGAKGARTYAVQVTEVTEGDGVFENFPSRPHVRRVTESAVTLRHPSPVSTTVTPLTDSSRSSRNGSDKPHAAAHAPHEPSLTLTTPSNDGKDVPEDEAEATIPPPPREPAEELDYVTKVLS